MLRPTHQEQQPTQGQARNAGPHHRSGADPQRINSIQHHVHPTALLGDRMGHLRGGESDERVMTSYTWQSVV